MPRPDDRFRLLFLLRRASASATVRYFGAAGVGECIATKRLAGSASRGASGSATGQTQRDLLVAKLGLPS
jgi:hypothetical protein